VLEAGFLVLLAVVVGFADLSPALIVLVMTVGWLLVALIEYFAWRQTQLAFSRVDAVAPAASEEIVEDVPPPPPPPPPPAQEVVEDVPPPAPSPVEEETIVAPRAGEAPPVEPETPAETAPTKFGAAERRTVHRLEPLQPQPRRRWILFGPYERRPEPPAEGDREEER
jgi:hypothetical protein